MIYTYGLKAIITTNFIIHFLGPDHGLSEIFTMLILETRDTVGTMRIPRKCRAG